MASTFRARYLYLLLILIELLLLASCTLGGEDLPTQARLTSESTLPEPQATATATIIPTPTTPPRRLTICLGAEPETLFIYGGISLAQSQILEAIYDGPIDTIGYQYHPVILEKLPDIADGDAVIEPVPIQAGDLVVNNAGQLVQLDSGEIVRPFGCSSSDCAIPWKGEPLELAQLSATFTLKENLKWSDSVPLTTADSVYSYQFASQCQNDIGPCGGLGLALRDGQEILPRTASYEAIDERSVRWTGVPGFLDPTYQTNFFIPLPEHQLSQYDPGDLFTSPEADQQPLGWGPYVITSWIQGEHISLRANPLYFRAQEAELKFDELLFRFIGQQGNNQLDLITSGGCDLLDQGISQVLMNSGIEELIQLQDEERLMAHFVAGPIWEHADFGIQPLSYDDGYQPGIDRPDYFRDVRVRQAFSMCMDRQKIIDELLFGQSLVPVSFIPEGHPLFYPDVIRYEYDPSAGSQLLQGAGWVDHDSDPQTPRQALGIQGIVDGTPLVVSYRTSNAEQRQAASQILADSLVECGIQIELLSGPGSEVYAPGPDGPVFGRLFDLAQFAWSAGNQTTCNLWTSEQIPGDPNLEDENGTALFPYGWGGVNATGFRDNEYDLACEQALGTVSGQPGYLEIHQSVQTIFSEQLPVIPLYQHLKLAVSRSDMCGFSLDPSAISEFWNIENFDYGEGCPE
jgi:peptide/nickel transport system substrate-binding protein